MRLAIYLVCAASAAFIWAAPARAQRWVFVPTSATGDLTESVTERAQRVASSRAPSGVSFLSGAEAARLFASLHSRERIALDEAQQQSLEDCHRRMAMSLARGQTAELQAEQTACAPILERASESELSAQPARQLFLQACYVMVQHMLANRLDQAALEQAMTCRSHVIDIPISERFATPEVREVFERAEAQLRAMPTATLEVDAAWSEPCQVFVRGLPVGRTPFRSEGLVAGRAILRVACGEHPGRVRSVELRSGSNVVQVDIRFDAAITSTDGHLALTYGSRDAWRELRAQHARVIAQALSASSVVLVTEDGDGTLLERVDSDGRIAGSARLTELTDAPIGSALRGLASGELLAGTSASGASASADEPHFANWIIGGAILAGGALALITPIWTLAAEGQCADAPAPGYCRTIVQFGPVSGTLLGVGIAAIIGGVVWLALAPIRVGVSTDGASARLWLTGEF